MSWSSTKKNPWGLTDSQCAAMDALVRIGCQKQAASELGISHRTIEDHIAKAREKIGVDNRVLAVLEWDRRARSPTEQAPMAEPEKPKGPRLVSSVWDLGQAAGLLHLPHN